MPYLQMFGVTFPVAVDTADVFGQAFGLKAIPVSFLVDEVGIIRLKGNGPTAGLLRQIEEVLKEPTARTRGVVPQLAAAESKETLEKAITSKPNDWQARVALARLYASEERFAAALSQLEAAAKAQPNESAIPFVWGVVLLDQNQKENALAKLKMARDLDPENWRIRKQIWAIEHPDKFYPPDSPDYDWQKEELEREKDAAKKAD